MEAENMTFDSRSTGASNWRLKMAAALVFSDLVSFTVAWMLALITRNWSQADPIPLAYFQSLFYLLPFMILTNYAMGLYNHNLSDVEELRRMTKATTSYFLIAAAIIFLLQKGILISRLTVGFAWVYALILAPSSRGIFRSIFIRYKNWGEPVVIFGNGSLANEVVDYLIKHPRNGFIPVGMIESKGSNRKNLYGLNIEAIDIFLPENVLPEWIKGVRTAFVVTTETSQKIYENLIVKQDIRFERIILVTSPEKTGSIWVQPLDIGGILALEMGQNLLNRTQTMVKRVFDLIIIFIAFPILVPFFCVVSLIIKIDSKGSVFYKQERIGLAGKSFKVWKFRSMVQGADSILKEYLEKNPEINAEYTEFRKLKHDPRITRVGRYLRKWSVDELPQIINVVKGEMSLVGPRPFMPDEVGFYGKTLSLYSYVRPGITGLWQISGRSSTNYSSRVNYDDYYLRNWSIWLDILVFTKTILIVLSGKNSY